MKTLSQFWSWLFNSNVRPRTRGTRSRLSVDQLDERIVPAGAVTAVVENGTLFITGDGEDNAFEIRNFLNNVRLVSLNGTAINGAVGLEDISGVSKDIMINLKGGDDLVQLNGGGVNAAVVSRDLIFSGGGGNDTLIGEPDALIGRDLIFNGGAGDTVAAWDDIFIGRNAIITGNADVEVTAINAVGSTVHGVLRIDSLARVDAEIEDMVLGRFKVNAATQAVVELNDVQVGGKVRIQGGSGADAIDIDLGSEILGSLLIDTQDGNDSVSLDVDVGGDVSILLGLGNFQDVDLDDSTIYGKLRIESVGSGSNTWNLDGLDVLGNALFLCGDGVDDVVFNDGEFFGRVTFVGGAGNDQVQISDGNSVTIRGVASFDLGLGNDTLQLGQGLGDANFLTQVTLNGGDGSDTLLDVAGDFSVPPVILSF